MWIQYCILGGWISKVDWTGLLDWQDSTIVKLPRWSSGYHEGQTGRQAVRRYWRVIDLGNAFSLSQPEKK